MLVSMCSFAQYEKLLNKNPEERKVEIQKLNNKLGLLNSDKSYFDEVNRIKKFANQHNDIELELEMDFMVINRMIFLNETSTKFKPETILKRCDVLYDKATENNLQDMKLRILYRKATYYWGYLDNYELGFETYFILDKELEKIASDEFPDKAFYLNTIGEAFYYFQDYVQAKEYFKKGLSITENNSNSSMLNSMKIGIGQCYRKLNKLDSSEYYYKKVIASKPYKDHELWKSMAKGNLAYIYFLKHKYEKAIPLYKESIKGTEQFKEDEATFHSLISLADIYLKKGQIGESKACLDKAEKLISILANPDNKLKRLRKFYQVVSKWHQLSGNKDLSIKYLDSTIVAQDIQNEKFSVLKLLRAQQKNDLQEHRLATLEIINEEQKKTNQRNLILLALASLIVGFSGVYYFQKNKFKREKRIQNLKLTLADQNLQMATQQLQDFTDKLYEKNVIIELLQEQTDNEVDNEVVEQIKKTTILTADDWDKFQNLFEKVHSGFLHRLTTKYKELTASEIRYITLAKMNLSQKEMANILGISPNSVRVTWHRVSKKLDLSDKDNLDNLLKVL